MNANMQVEELFVSLNLLDYKDDDIPHAKKGKMLGYVQSVKVTYGLNMIPTATITIPLGSTLNQDGSTSPSYAYGAGSMPIYKLGDDSIPVGIYVRGAFFDTLGASGIQEFCIFKGYVTDTLYERSAMSATLSVKLIHWLCHLTEFPLVSSLLAPNAASDVAAQYPLTISAPEAARMGAPSGDGSGASFTPVGGAIMMMRNIASGANIWDALKAMFAAISPDISRLSKTDPGYVSKQYLERVNGALEAVIGSDLDFISKTKEDFQVVKNSVANMLMSLSCGYFAGSTIWTKLIGTFLPGFYMALTPRVSEANVIPAPGQCMGIAKAKMISKSEYYQTSYSRTAMPTLFGGVLLYLDPNMYKLVDDAECSIRYPEELLPGPIQVVTAPAWLNKDMIPLVGGNDGATTARVFYDQYKNSAVRRKTRARQVKKGRKARRSTVERILRNLVRITYQLVACGGRQISVSMPLRMDLTAGEMVGLELPSGVVEATQEYIYGTIDSITLDIGPRTAKTSITLTNIRTKAEMKNEELTSSEGILYSKAWKSNQKLILCEPVK